MGPGNRAVDVESAMALPSLVLNVSNGNGNTDAPLSLIDAFEGVV